MFSSYYYGWQVERVPGYTSYRYYYRLVAYGIIITVKINTHCRYCYCPIDDHQKSIDLQFVKPL